MLMIRSLVLLRDLSPAWREPLRYLYGIALVAGGHTLRKNWLKHSDWRPATKAALGIAKGLWEIAASQLFR